VFICDHPRFQTLFGAIRSAEVLRQVEAKRLLHAGRGPGNLVAFGPLAPDADGADLLSSAQALEASDEVNQRALQDPKSPISVDVLSNWAIWLVSSAWLRSTMPTLVNSKEQQSPQAAARSQARTSRVLSMLPHSKRSAL